MKNIIIVVFLLLSSLSAFAQLPPYTPGIFSPQYLRTQYSLNFGDESNIYLSETDAGDLGRYLKIYNSEDTGQIPAGIKSGGLLVSNSYNFANPVAGDAVIKRTLSIGNYENAASDLAIANHENPRDYPLVPLYVRATNMYTKYTGVFEGFGTSSAVVSIRNSLATLYLGVNSNTSTTPPQVATPSISSSSGKLDLGNILFLDGAKVGIGTNAPSQKLTVKGTVYSTEVKVDVAAGTGPDYVFEPTYTLPSLDSVQSYINQNKHLPEVPSAKEMEANGVNLGEMNMLLLKKVEELTLYVIELKKENSEFKKELKKIANKN